MTKNYSISFEERSLPERKPPLNPEICLRVEEFLKTVKLENDPSIKCTLPHRNDLDCRLFYGINQAIIESNLSEAEQTQMYWHLELYELTTQTLTENEFKIIFPLSACDTLSEEILWDHNKRCLVFFLNGYREIVRPILFIKEEGFHKAILDNIEWLGKMIERHHEIRTYFPYCKTCPYNDVERCSFWDGVLSKLRTICADLNEERIARVLTQYCTQLKIECKIPVYYDELKKPETNEGEANNK